MQLSLEGLFEDILEDIIEDDRREILYGGFVWWSMIEWLMISINLFYTEKKRRIFFWLASL